MFHNVVSDFWRAATALLLLVSIATHGLRPVDLDFDLHPAPFGAYDDDVVRASLGPSRTTDDLKAVGGAVGGIGKLRVPLLAAVLASAVQLQAPGAPRSMWFHESAAEAIRGAVRTPYLARAPPQA